jgi:hypothetical protein
MDFVRLLSTNRLMTRDRLLLAGLLLWGLAMIAPDLLRVVHPLGSFGFYANNDGLIYSVTGPFPDEASSPAWEAGLRVGDQLDLSRLRCSLKHLASCGSALAAFGGLQFVLPGSHTDPRRYRKRWLAYPAGYACR